MKVKVFDNATFSFTYTFRNFKEFFNLNKLNILLLVIISLASVTGGLLELRFLKNDLLGEMRIQSYVQEVNDEIRITNPEYNGDLRDVIELGEEDSEYAYIVEYKIQDFKDDTWVKLKENRLSIAMLIIYYLLAVIPLLIIPLKWFRYCYKTEYDPSLLKDIGNLFRILGVNLLGTCYAIVALGIMIGLGALGFWIHNALGVLLSIMGTILFIIFSLYLTVAIDLMTRKITLGIRDYNMISLFKLVKGNILRICALIFMISISINIFGQIVIASSSGFPGFSSIVMAAILYLAIYLISSIVTATASLTFYKGLIDKDSEFLV